MWLNVSWFTLLFHTVINIQCQSFKPIILIVFPSAGTWSFSVSELAAPGVEVGRLTATDPDLGENAQLEFTIMDAEEAEIFNISGRDQEAVIVLDKVGRHTVAVCWSNFFFTRCTGSEENLMCKESLLWCGVAYRLYLSSYKFGSPQPHTPKTLQLMSNNEQKSTKQIQPIHFKYVDHVQGSRCEFICFSCVNSKDNYWAVKCLIRRLWREPDE